MTLCWKMILTISKNISLLGGDLIDGTWTTNFISSDHTFDVLGLAPSVLLDTLSKWTRIRITSLQPVAFRTYNG